MGESTELGMQIRSSETRVILVYLDDIKMAGKKQNVAPLWKSMMKNVTLTNRHHFLTMYTWDVLSVNANRMKQSLNSDRKNV